MTEAKITEKQVGSRVREKAKGLFRHENAVLALVLAVLIAGMAILTKGRTAPRTTQ